MMRVLTLFVLAFGVAACSGAPDNGMGFRDVGPEQSTFLVTPAGPLQTPPSRALPQPTPGGTNRAAR
ncbi:DUF3035 domain-containing protein [Loktanella sp. Alg231-35]|uniref:DUF3035 domain-containing protein n=1 Tax=Loktanella sp. Alg231-35 TaxID=1922220 RepID=UPI000D54D15F|nr:DUF3035 domain-containing protein [Loktanella sp. Alg231-35]